MTITTSFEKTLYVAEIRNDGATWFLCREHAEDFAEDNGLTWNRPGSLDFTEDPEELGIGVWQDVFGQVETDYPIGCEGCDLDRETLRTTWLGNQLTPDGVQYLLDPTRNIDDAVIEFYGYKKEDN